MSLPQFLFCNNKSELPNDSLILQTTAPPYIMGKLWQFPGTIPDGFINSTIPQAKIPGYRLYVRYFDSLERDVMSNRDILQVISEMAEYFLTNKIKTNAGAYKRYKE